LKPLVRLISSDKFLKPEQFLFVQQGIDDLLPMGALSVQNLNVPLPRGVVVSGYGVEEQDGIGC
jgi:hypothetical protein